MFAAGLTRLFVKQVMLMDLDAVTAVWGDDNVSVDTGTVGIKNCFTSFEIPGYSNSGLLSLIERKYLFLPRKLHRYSFLVERKYSQFHYNITLIKFSLLGKLGYIHFQCSLLKGYCQRPQRL